MALDFQAIGLKPKLVELEFPRVRELYRTKAIHGGLFPSRHSSRALETTRNVHKAKDSSGYWYEHPVIEERLEALRTVVDTAERSRLLREIGDHKFDAFAEIPMFWLFAEAAVNPKYIAEYAFPGVITGPSRIWSTLRSPSRDDSTRRLSAAGCCRLPVLMEWTHPSPKSML